MRILASLAGMVALFVGCPAEHRAVEQLPPGESWFPRILSEDASEYLPDYSYSGYRWGEKAPPRPGVTFEVTEFGAIPNDGGDDTEAFLAALQAAGEAPGTVVIGMPPGRFHLSQILFLERSQLVLRGAGSGEGQTVLAFTQPLEKMRTPEESEQMRERMRKLGSRQRGQLFSPFSWNGGVIWARNPRFAVEGEASKAVAGRRGERRLLLEDEADIRAGQVFWLEWFNPEGETGSLLGHIFGDSRVVLGSRVYERPEVPPVRQPVTVVSVEGRHLQLREPLLHDVRPEWTPHLLPVNYLEEIGLEDFRIEFPETRHAGHHIEEGWNGIYLTRLQHSWVRNVSIHHADSGIISKFVKNVTLEKVGVHGRGGHYCVMTGISYGVLTKDFECSAPAVHSPSFNAGAQLCVFSDGSVREATLDQHRGYPMQNLFDNLRVQRSRTNLFERGGRPQQWAPTAGAFTTFWNIRAEVDVEIQNLRAHWERVTKGTVPLGPVIDDAPRARIVGLHGNHAFSLQYGPDAYVEGLNRPGIAVPSLYDYQLQRRPGDAARLVRADN